MSMEVKLSFLARIRFFQKSVVCVAVFFLGLMFWVAVVAHTKRSGSTGMDMGSIQKIRFQEDLKKQEYRDLQALK